MIAVKSFIFNPFQENTYILSDLTGQCIIIDPGCSNDNEKSTLFSFISSNKLTPVKLVNTHCHIDHILGNRWVAETWSLELYMHKADLFILENGAFSANMFGVAYETSPDPTHFLTENDQLRFGESSLDILFTPGHSPGSISFYDKTGGQLISGDVLFQQSIGRTDLPGGNYDTLIQSIREKLFTLPDDVIVYSGHGPSTTIGDEKAMNPYVN